jgi:glycosyltransferase involved in cell wall biosynthesis
MVATVRRRHQLAPRPGREHVCIIVQNLPVPLDRRVWNECNALVAAGYRVSVICPKGPDDPSFQELDGVRIHKYAPPPAKDGHLALAYEFAYCWTRTALLARRIHRHEPIDAIQACNPPDTYWALASLFKPLGVRFVFDHHDLCPEIYRSRFDRHDGALLRVLLGLERATFATADHVISTNESYRQVAITRGRRRPDEVTVVRSGPDPERLRPVPADPTVRGDNTYLCAYLGIMGHQDGVDVVLRAADIIVNEWGRTDVGFALLGFGDCYDDLRALSRELELDDRVTFTGRVELDEIRRYLSSADVGLSPDPRSPFNDVSTMNKTMEYMACGLPVVAFDLHETRISAGDAAAYAPDDDPRAFAKAIVSLLDEPEMRAEMGARGRHAIETELGWPTQAAKYVRAYDRLFGGDDHEDDQDLVTAAATDGDDRRGAGRG